MSVLEADLRIARRRLLLRDSLAFLSLTAIAVVLFVLTLALFHSFSQHRIELAQRWYTRGQADLAAHRPAQAVTSLRTALSYDPNEHSYELLLAEALGEAGDVDEALAYFSNLWEAEPGSGPLNLQLARLSAKKKHNAEAVHYYRASIYGTWEGDGSARRREVRLELIRFLMSTGDFATAQTELLIAAGNASEDPSVRAEIAKLMAQAGDLNSALTQYEKLLAIDPNDLNARESGGDVAFQLGHYATTVKLLRGTLLKGAGLKGSARRDSHEGELSDHSREILVEAAGVLALDPSENLPDRERVLRIVHLHQIAQARWSSCEAKLMGSGALPANAQSVADEWKKEGTKPLRTEIAEDSDREQAEIELTYKTEMVANQLCGAPTGDDALVSLLAKSPGTVGQ